MIQESPHLRWPLNNYTIWAFIQKVFPPSAEHLHNLSRHDRPGMDIDIPESHLELGRKLLEAHNFQQALLIWIFYFTKWWQRMGSMEKGMLIGG